jgi:hypothetical protein
LYLEEKKMRNKMFGVRLNPEIVEALQHRYPGLPVVAAIRCCIEETLGLKRYNAAPNHSELDIVGSVNEILMSVYSRLDRLEAIAFSDKVDPDKPVDPVEPDKVNPVDPDKPVDPVDPDKPARRTRKRRS